MVEVFRPRRRSPFPQENPAVCEVKVKLMGMGVQSFGVRKHVVKRVHVSSLQGSKKCELFLWRLSLKWNRSDLNGRVLGSPKRAFLADIWQRVFRKLIYLVRWFGYDHQPCPGLIICVYIYVYIDIDSMPIYTYIYLSIYIHGNPPETHLFYIFITWLCQKGVTVTLHTGLFWGIFGNSFKRGYYICIYSSVVSKLGWFNLTSMIAFWEERIQNAFPAKSKI